MTTTIYIIRHAEAEGNVYRRSQGQYNSLLTPRAYQQLPYLAQRFADVPLDAVFSSDLFRAWRTACAVAEPHGLSVQVSPAVREINMGDWEDLPWAELIYRWPEQYALWKARPWAAAPPHGESVLEAGQRMLNGVRDLARQRRGQTIAVVSHGSAIRGALTIAHGYRPEQMSEIGWGDNTCVTKWEMDDADQIHVLYENDASHLPQELSTFAAIAWKDDKGVPQTPQMWFRPADLSQPNDREQLTAFMRELHRNAYGTDAGLQPAALLQQAQQAQQVNPRAVTFGILEDGTLAALVYLKAHDFSIPDAGLVGGFCLASAYRGCGLSQQMLGQAVSVYRAMGKRFLCAHVAEHNERAKGFYRKFAFVPSGTFDDPNGHHFRMSLEIAVPPCLPRTP